MNDEHAPQVYQECNSGMKLIPYDECIRLANSEYVANINYAEVVASLIEHLRKQSGRQPKT